VQMLARGETPHPKRWNRGPRAGSGLRARHRLWNSPKFLRRFKPKSSDLCQRPKPRLHPSVLGPGALFPHTDPLQEKPRNGSWHRCRVPREPFWRGVVCLM